MKRIARLALALGSLTLAACCDSEATVQVHVVDGETGDGISQPLITIDGTTATCNQVYASPAPTDDGGTVISPPDMMVGPPPTNHFCDTFTASVDPGGKTVHVSASGYFGTDVQIDAGDEGGGLKCPSPKDVEITVALYKRPH